MEKRKISYTENSNYICRYSFLQEVQLNLPSPLSPLDGALVQRVKVWKVGESNSTVEKTDKHYLSYEIEVLTSSLIGHVDNVYPGYERTRLLLL